MNTPIPPQILAKRDEYQAFFKEGQRQAQQDSELLSDAEMKSYLKKAEDASGEAGLKPDEKYYPYPVKGEPHIGFGHKLTQEEIKNKTYEQGITFDEREQLLDRDFRYHKGRARSKYGNREFDRLKNSYKNLLTDYSFSNIHKKDNSETDLSKAIRSNKPDQAIIEEAGKYTTMGKIPAGRQKLRNHMFNAVNSPGAMHMFDLMDKFHDGDSKEIIETLYPGTNADEMITKWKTHLSILKELLKKKIWLN